VNNESFVPVVYDVLSEKDVYCSKPLVCYEACTREVLRQTSGIADKEKRIVLLLFLPCSVIRTLFRSTVA
jgi:hypothetical protein